MLSRERTLEPGQGHMVASADPRIAHVDWRPRLFDRGHDGHAGLLELRRVLRRDCKSEFVGVDDRVEVPAVRRVVPDSPQAWDVDLQVELVDVGRDVDQTDGPGDAVADRDVGDDESSWRVESDRRDWLGHRDKP